MIRIQLIVFALVTVVALIVLIFYYVRLPAFLGVGQYTLTADLPAAGGLYSTANVTYDGTTIGKVTDVEPTEHGARATMSISDDYKIPVDASANVHSVSAVGEQYLDLVAEGTSTKYFSPGQTITKSTIPTPIGDTIDAAGRAVSALPQDGVSKFLDETSQAVGGLGPALQRLVDSTSVLAKGFKDNTEQLNNITDNVGPLLDSQIDSQGNISRFLANLNKVTAQAVEKDQVVRDLLEKGGPTASGVAVVFRGIEESLPQTLANVAIVADMLKRYHTGLEQTLVILPEAASAAQAVVAPYKDSAALNFALAVNAPPPCLTGFLPASEMRAPADTSTADRPEGLSCKIPKDFQGNSVRGARNYPCQDVPGKRAATPEECHGNAPYEPLGTNPYYGDPNQILNCPAPAGRCDQPPKPGLVFPAPSVNNGRNPLPANELPGTPPPTSDPLTAPGSGTVQCSGQQPNPCVYTPSQGPAAIYRPSSGQVVGPDGTKYQVTDSSSTGDDGWKEMLAPTS